jgi:hypothetical protein
MLVGAARNLIEGGQLFRIPLSRDRAGSRRRPAPGRPGADNTAKYDITESESLLFGSNFGVATDIRTGPDGTSTSCRCPTARLYRDSRRR